MTQDRRPSRRKASPARPKGPPKSPLVAFDFDGTITVRDSFTAFLKWREGSWRYTTGLIRLLPAALAYLGHRDRGIIKAAAARAFLSGLTLPELEADAEEFASEYGPTLLRPDALATWRKWRAEGARLVIVSASPSFVVRPFADRLGADALIATELAFDRKGRVKGAFSTPNCRGPEKIVRLKQVFGDDLVLKAAYGDTSGDKEMLEMAEIKGYRVFTGRP